MSYLEWRRYVWQMLYRTKFSSNFATIGCRNQWMQYLQAKVALLYCNQIIAGITIFWVKRGSRYWLDLLLELIFGTFCTVDNIKIWFIIIWTSSKDKNFPRIWRMWLKNWVSYAHFNFELLKSVTALFFGPHPWNFNQVCNFYR